MTSTPQLWKNISTFASEIILSIKYFEPSASSVGCQWYWSVKSPLDMPSLRPRSMNSFASPLVTSFHLPSSFTLVAIKSRTSPLVKSPPSEP